MEEKPNIISFVTRWAGTMPCAVGPAFDAARSLYMLRQPGTYEDGVPQPRLAEVERAIALLCGTIEHYQSLYSGLTGCIRNAKSVDELKVVEPIMKEMFDKSVRELWSL